MIFDHETDVLVAGSGAAAFSAAITAGLSQSLAFMVPETALPPRQLTPIGELAAR